MSRPLPVLRFRAADMDLALAATAVASFVPETPAARALAEVLGAPPRAPDTTTRTLRLQHDGQECLVTVEGPVHLEQAQADHVMAPPALLDRDRLLPVAGFLSSRGRLVLLLDAESLIRRASAGRLRGDPP